jgi:hypothetical protein
MGSLLQLLSKGVQDTPLFSKDILQSSLFVSKYRRHADFSIDHRSIIFDNNTEDGMGKRLTMNIPRVGDMVTNLVLRAHVTRSTSDGDHDDILFPLENLVDRVQMYVGGVLVEERPGLFYRIYDETHRTLGQRMAYSNMGNFSRQDVPGTKRTLYMPLDLSCCRPTNPLPLLALAYAEVQLVITLKETPGPGIVLDNISFGLDCEYVYLVHEQRNALLEPMQYPVMQIQHRSFSLEEEVWGTIQQYPLTFNHPCTRLYIAASHRSRHGSFTGSGVNFEDAEGYAPIKSMKLVVNGQEMIKSHMGSFYRQQSIFHRKLLPSAGIYVLDFRSTLNFSRVDSAVLVVTFKEAVDHTAHDDAEGIGLTDLNTLHVFAENYNWLKIQDGQGSIAFSC